MQKIKIEFEGQMKRFSIKKQTTFSKFKQELSQFLNVPSQQLNIKYKDDESDIISLSSQQEFEEAIRCSENNILRLQISTQKIKPGNQRQPEMKPETKPETKPENQSKQFRFVLDFPFNIVSLSVKPTHGNYVKSEENEEDKYFQTKKYFSKFSQPNQTSSESEAAPQTNNNQKKYFQTKKYFSKFSQPNQTSSEPNVEPPTDNNQQKKYFQTKKYFSKFSQPNQTSEPNAEPPTNNNEDKKQEKVEQVAEKKEEPVVGKKEEPVVEKKKEPVAEKKEEPVVEKKEEPVAEKKEEPVVEKKEEHPFMEKLKVLEEMGFDEKEKNISLLAKHKGELIQVIRELLD